MSDSLVTRRAALRLFGLGAATALLAACQSSAPAASPTTAPAPTAAPKPTTAPAPVASPAASAASPAAAPSASPAVVSASPSAAAALTVPSPVAQQGPDAAAAAGWLPLGPGPSAAAPAHAWPGQPRSGGTLKVGNLGDLPNLDGHQINGDNTIYPIWDRLIDLDASLQPHPSLATSWEANADMTQITFHLRPGVKFHNGKDLTSAEVAWNYNRIKTDKTIDGGVKANFFQPLDTIDTPDPMTVVLHATSPWTAVYDLIAWVNILEPTAFQADKNKPVGTGPFTFGEWVQGDHISLKKNPSYWQSGKPYLDGITIQIFTDPQAMETQLEGGGIDLAILPTARDAVRLAKDNKFVVGYNQTSGSVNVVPFQCKDGAGPTTNKLFRQALSYTMDRKRWTDTVLLGVGTPKSLPITPTNPAYEAAKDNLWTFDLDKAKSLLQQAGVSNATIEFDYSAVSADYASVGQIWQQDLAKVGITLNLKSLEAVAYSQQLFGGAYPNTIGATSLFGQLHPSFFNANAYYSPFYNWENFKDDQFTQVGVAMQNAVTPQQQQQAYPAWVNYIQDQAFCLPWSNTVPRVAASAKVQGFQYNMLDFFMLDNSWLSA